MRQYSNAYIIGFAVAVCLVCSVVVSTSAVALRERQDLNKALDRQTKVLLVAGLLGEGQSASADEVQHLFEQNIRTRVVDLQSGDYDDTVDAAAYDQRRATKDPSLSREAPANRAGITRLPSKALIYQRVADEEIELLILPIEGKGLWSTLYGFLALAPDTTTIEGITFYEHGETPGLGGEVDNASWKALWRGRKAYDADGEPAITVIKGAAGPAEEDPYRVDGISGATLTARGVSHLVQFWLGENGFEPYLEKFRVSGSAS
ncbi:MAG: Na(+)-translocating NADH-quinone reductase subunit C [Acidobacteria bacterium]|nr:Na(+)-translocating NADH-quinone reductase subunit C [Acidobacteriota bacterium]